MGEVVEVGEVEWVGYVDKWVRGVCVGTWVRGYACMRVHGYADAWVRRYVATWVRGYVGTWVRGWVAGWIDGQDDVWMDGSWKIDKQARESAWKS